MSKQLKTYYYIEVNDCNHKFIVYAATKANAIHKVYEYLTCIYSPQVLKANGCNPYTLKDICCCIKLSDLMPEDGLLLL